MTRIHTLCRTQRIPRSLSEVFSFFETPENLAKITPVKLGFQILTPSPIAMHRGAVIDYVIKVVGLSLHWRTLITTYEPSCKFVDEQLKGPYLMWHHTHHFQETDAGTIMTDTVHYAMPFGYFGSLVHALFVKRQIDTIFTYREKAIANYFAAHHPALEEERSL